MTNTDRQLSRKFRNRRIGFVVALAVILALATVGVLNRALIRTYVSQISGQDYAGDGHGLVNLVVTPGETGTSVAKNLVELGVVKNFDVVYRLMLSQEPRFFPGTYRLKKQMSSSSALAALQNPANLVVSKITIEEGLRLSQVLIKLAAATNIPLANFQSAASDKAALKIPSEAPSAEGFLFPATYEFPIKSSAVDILRIMVDRTYEELRKFSVANSDILKVLTFASIIQKEARQTSDFYKVSRVFTNRLQIDMPLQSDATVSYGSGGTTVTTTDAERSDPNGYNTYLNPGLPIGPISAPGALAIDAALHPVAGKWLYFCAINLKTGETVFSETVSQHEVAVAKFRAWMAQNPGWNG